MKTVVMLLFLLAFIFVAAGFVSLHERKRRRTRLDRASEAAFRFTAWFTALLYNIQFYTWIVLSGLTIAAAIAAAFLL